tara:strand:+ start:1489 stop:2193 length:705 start_codon:yes stop_codon:yes gene_type:complete
MTKDFNWVAIIPARIGSKRVKKKNLEKIGDLSLVEIAVKKAVTSKIFKEVIISTDSSEIESQAVNSGAKSYGLRNKNIAMDTTSTVEVINNILEKLDDSVKGFSLIQCTSPFTKIQTIISVSEIAAKNNISCITVRKLEHTFLEWVLVQQNEFIKPLLNDDSQKKRSQDCTPLFSPSGNIYSVNLNYYKNNNYSLIGQNCLPYTISDANELVDIDTYEDLNYAREIFDIQGQIF